MARRQLTPSRVQCKCCWRIHRQWLIFRSPLTQGGDGLIHCLWLESQRGLEAYKEEDGVNKRKCGDRKYGDAERERERECTNVEGGGGLEGLPLMGGVKGLF